MYKTDKRLKTFLLGGRREKEKGNRKDEEGTGSGGDRRVAATAVAAAATDLVSVSRHPFPVLLTSGSRREVFTSSSVLPSALFPIITENNKAWKPLE